MNIKLTPCLEREMSNGIQKLYRFDNGYGASVIRHSFSYGGGNGLWELAVLKFEGAGDEDWHLCYTTKITDDVIGCLTDDEVEELLKDIQGLEQEK